MYGYQNSSEVGPGKSGGKFGLNAEVFVTKFEYNPNGGKEGAASDAIDLNVKIQEKEYMQRFFPVSKVYSKDGGELTDSTTDEYKEAMEKAVNLLNAQLSDIVKCFVSEEDLVQALSVPLASFTDFAKVLDRLVKSNPNWKKQPVDVFLEYQWTPTGDNTRSFLTLPKNVKQGSYIVKSNVGTKWIEEKTDSHIKYFSEAGDTHPFKRNKWYVESSFANQTILDEATAQSGADMNATATGTSEDW